MPTARELILENRRVSRDLFRFPPQDDHLRGSIPPASFSPVAPKRPRSGANRPHEHGTEQTPIAESSALRPQSTVPSSAVDALVAAPTSTSTALVPTASDPSDSVPSHPKHLQWREYRVVASHLGWPRCVAFDASNAFFATGSADRTIKLWNSATGRLNLTLTGHVSTVRAIAFSQHRPYMFSAAEDKTVKCWDLERNSVIRSYHGHLSAVYSLALHPTLDVAVTGGRDSTVRVWDIRSRQAIFVLPGHRETVHSLLTHATDPQIVSSSADSTIRMWDLAKGSASAILTHHKKAVRALASHPAEFSFVSAAADAFRTWALPDGVLMRNFATGCIINDVDVNQDGLVCAARDDGTVSFWDFETAESVCEVRPRLQPGSLDAESGVLAVAFDRSGSRIVSCHMDKTVRMWREIDDLGDDADD